MKEYGYMIKSVDISKDGKYGIGYGGFKYPLKKGAKIVAKDWNKKPTYEGGIFGLIHETEEHYIVNRKLWLILKYEKGTEIIVENSKIKVPYVWIVDWGDAQKIQSIFKELTGKPYEYEFAVQITDGCSTQTAGDGSTQTAGDRSTQTAGICSTQTAGDESTQTADDRSTQTAGICSTQTAGNGSTQSAGYRSTQTAGNGSTQTAGDRSTQTAGNGSTQTAGDESTQSAGSGSISIIRGMKGFCKHIGKVLQILVFYDYKVNNFIYLTKEINDNKKHKLEAAVEENGIWVLKDTIIEEGK